ncbi:MAG: alpha/beta hydrolase [Gammaproteobacteria bacterium]|nr:MAG: alpha/beta hydrolase [Gammaproteobacteria bacterium]
MTIINFAHANGFPAGSYQTFFQYFTDSNTQQHNYKVVANDQYGHNSRFPVSNNWPHLVDELIHFVKQQPEPVVAIGHSFGGVISFIAACKHPELFKGLIMLDPPVITGIESWAIKLLKKTPYIDNISPAGKSKNRRQFWPAETDLAKQFSRSKLFSNFDPRCLQDYVNSGVKLNKDQLELVFDRQVETDIFRNMPTHLAKFKQQLKIPAALITANQSDVAPAYFFRRFAKLNKNIKQHHIDGGHMFPLEKPKETFKLIDEIIQAWAI